jgi:hypothetical protein
MPDKVVERRRIGIPRSRGWSWLRRQRSTRTELFERSDGRRYRPRRRRRFVRHGFRKATGRRRPWLGDRRAHRARFIWLWDRRAHRAGFIWLWDRRAHRAGFIWLWDRGARRAASIELRDAAGDRDRLFLDHEDVIAMRAPDRNAHLGDAILV